MLQDGNELQGFGPAKVVFIGELKWGSNEELWSTRYMRLGMWGTDENLTKRQQTRQETVKCNPNAMQVKLLGFYSLFPGHDDDGYGQYAQDEESHSQADQGDGFYRGLCVRGDLPPTRPGLADLNDSAISFWGDFLENSIQFTDIV